MGHRQVQHCGCSTRWCQLSLASASDRRSPTCHFAQELPSTSRSMAMQVWLCVCRACSTVFQVAARSLLLDLLRTGHAKKIEATAWDCQRRKGGGICGGAEGGL